MIRFAMICVVVDVIGHVSATWNNHQHLNSQSKLIGNIESLINQKTDHINTLQSELSQIISRRSSNFEKDQYVGNPLTALSMVRRLAIDWSSIARTIGRYYPMYSLGLGGARWPDQNDVLASARALVRIQSTYAMQTNSLAKGNLTDNSIVRETTAADSFSIASQHYKSRNFKEAVEWLQQALDKISNGDSSISHEVVLYYLAAAKCFLGDTQYSISVLYSLSKGFKVTEPPETLENSYQEMIINGCTDLSAIEEDNSHVKEIESSVHSKLCQGHGKQDSSMKCRYVHYQQPHLRFQPFKLEDLQLDPPVIRFYDAITDKEATTLKNTALKRIAYAQVLGYSGATVSDYRTSQVAWIHGNESKAASSLTRRIAAMTRMDLKLAEAHQLSRYAVGGEFMPHIDSFGILYGVPFEDDRMATLMFYLNDVTQGGNTAFVNWNLSVPPVKNSAVLWFNFLPNGEQDHLSRHSGCPVIEGEKWVLNKWIHNGGNEFLFPCNLNKDSSFAHHYV